MSRAFIILRTMIFVFILAAMLAWVPMAFYQGNFLTSLILSAGMFFLSLLLAAILYAFIKRGG